MIRRVVVGFDGSEGALAALSWGVVEARLRGVPLVAHAALDVDGPVPWPVPDPLTRSSSEILLAELRQQVQDRTEAYPAAFRYSLGDAAAQLISAGEEGDLLAVGSRGRNPLAGLLLGSVSRTCLEHAPGPVVVVRQPPPQTPRGRVIVGLDASEPSRRALRAGVEEARLRGATVHAIHAVEWDRLGVELVLPTTDELLSWGGDLVAQQLAQTGVAAQPLVLRGPASAVLVGQSEDADLLVLGSRGQSPLAAVIMGSTSDYCARHAFCPVMVIR